jgi:glycosyltransferase involved in cell wall biosynthesis
MNTYPIITVVIPYFNQLTFAEDLLCNINSYVSEKIEAIITDDCSTDGSELFFRRNIKSPYIKYRKNQSNLGARENVRQSADCATGKYIIFCAGDDFLIPAGLISLCELIQNNGRETLYICPGIICGRDENIHYLRSGKLKTRSRAVNIFPHIKSNEVKDLLLYSAIIPGYIWTQGLCISASIFKKSGFHKTGEVDDWGLLHNLYILYKNEPFDVKLQSNFLCAISNIPGSFGTDSVKQTKRQLSSVYDNWHNSLKIEAMHQVISKKMLRNNKSIDETLQILRLGLDYFEKIKQNDALI